MSYELESQVGENAGRTRFLFVLFGTGIPSLAIAGFYLLLASIMTQLEYGMMSYYIASALTASNVVLIGLDRVIPSILPKTPSRELVRSASVVILSLGLLAALILSIIISPFAALIVIPEATFLLGQSILLGENAYSKYFWFRLSFRFLQIGLSITFYLFYGLTGLFVGYFIGLAGPIIITGRHVLSTTSSVKDSIETHSGFISRSYFFNLTAIASGYLDKVVVGVWYGFVILSSYALSYQLFWLLEILPTGLLLYLLPERSRGNEQRETRILGLLFAVLLAAAGYLLFPMVVTLILPSYSSITPLVQVLCLATIPSSIASMLIADLFAQERAGAAAVANLAGSSSHITLLLVLGVFGLVGLGLAVLTAKVLLVVSLLVTRLIISRHIVTE
ncbi:MAG: hypothetical protein EAX87_11820 [Candidatus Thorarchaeota archaeon]|nr:hypothetical protein [Candidatus Thorarchaeota archaeon]